MTSVFLLAVVIGLSLGSVDAWSHTVSGTIRDSTGTPLEGVKVEIVDGNKFFGETLRATVFTTVGGMSPGTYMSTYNASDGEDPFIRVKWELDLGTAFGNNVIQIVDDGSGTSSSSWTATTTYTPKDSAVVSDITAHTTINLAMNQAAPANYLTPAL